MHETTPLPRMVCRRTLTPPVLEAVLDDPAWEAADARPLDLLRESSEAAAAAPASAATVRCLWDSDRFYVGFGCRCRNVWASKTMRDDKLWDEPVVEVFLDPVGSGQSFFEFQVNPLATIYDAFVAEATRSSQWQHWCRWNCDGLHVQVAPRCPGGEGWSAVLAIPLAAIRQETGVTPGSGDVWRGNFCRYDYLEGPASTPELSCWAPVVGVFDDVARFGEIVFAGPTEEEENGIRRSCE